MPGQPVRVRLGTAQRQTDESYENGPLMVVKLRKGWYAIDYI